MGIILVPLLLILSSAIIPAIIIASNTLKESNNKHVTTYIVNSYFLGIVPVFIVPLLIHSNSKVYIFSLIIEVWFWGGGLLILSALIFWITSKKTKNLKPKMIASGLFFAVASLPYVWFVFATDLIKIFGIKANY